MGSYKFAALLGLGAVALAGCSTTTSGSPARGASTSASTSGSASLPTSSVSIPYTLTAPHPPPNKDNNGTSFDPCVAYTAAEIRSWGVDPEKVEDTGTQGLDVRGCGWTADGWQLAQTVINNPLSDYLDNPQYPVAHRETIGGLDAVVYQDRVTGASGCTVALPSQQATVHVLASIYNEKTGRKGLPDPCAKAIEVAAFVATKLPK